MPRLKPWFDVIKPREDLREGRPLDASEFAVHLDQVRERRGSPDYWDATRFFERTYLTANLRSLGAEVVRRLAGVKVETSAVFNMSTQFGGGKTHALTLLYHLASAGPAASAWKGVGGILATAKQAGSPVEIAAVPRASVAVFVGTEFDSISGRGGADGTPIRYTPWGEIGWQLGPDSFRVVAEHDAERTAPGGDVLRAMLPEGPVLILMDELMNWIGRNRHSGLGAQFYEFLQNLSETVRAEDQKVLVVSIPKSESSEMTVEDQQDFDRILHLLERLSKPVVMSVEAETSEIIRRRLFEWGGAVPEEGRRTIKAFAEWVAENRRLLGDGDADNARERFEAAYPFHPAVLGVFERKWQSLPSFQRTRGILRLLALWVSKAYQEGYRQAHPDPLIGLGSAPLEDPDFRQAAFAELGNDALEGPVTTDIAGRKDSHAVRLDREATDEVRKRRLHQAIAVGIFFESNGGATRTEASLAELRFAVGEPGFNVAEVEPILDSLTSTCYYLTANNNRYRFSLAPNLVMVLAGKRAEVDAKDIEARVRTEVQSLFKANASSAAAIERLMFPSTTEDVPDRPALSLVVLGPGHGLDNPAARPFIESIVHDRGSLARVYKNGLLFAASSSLVAAGEEARKVLAIESIAADVDLVRRLEELQQRDLPGQEKRAQRDLVEACWRAYRHIFVLAKSGELREIDLGLVHSSAASSIVELIVNRLIEDGEITTAIGPGRLLNYWPSSVEEAWSTKAVRDAFYASPQLPRVAQPQAILRAIQEAVTQGQLAYAGRSPHGAFTPIYLEEPIPSLELDFSDDWVLLKPEIAKRYLEPAHLERLEVKPAQLSVQPNTPVAFSAHGYDQHGSAYPVNDPQWSASGGAIDGAGLFIAENAGFYTVSAEGGGRTGSAHVQVSASLKPSPAGGLEWSGEIPSQKWTQFYTRILTKLVAKPGLEIRVDLRVPPEAEVSDATHAEVETALRELGLDDDVRRE